MEKRTLVGLLAIPIFSLAIAFNSFSATTYDSFYQESQESKKIKTKTVAAAVIDFLLRNPKTADKMNPTQQTALGILGDLLGTQGQREHEIDYATAGRSQLIINTSDGRQAQVVRDINDNIYLVMDGVIYPVAQELVNQASNIPGIENATLSQYNLGGLESVFNSNPTDDISQYYEVQKGGEYLSDIAKKFDVPASNIFYWADAGGPIWDMKSELRPISERKKIGENRKKISSRYTLWISKEKYKNEILAVFSYKWHRDLNNDGALDFNEFNQIKRTLYNDEDFNIGIKYQTEKGFIGNLELKIFEEYTGRLVMEEKPGVFFPHNPAIIHQNGGPIIEWQHIPAGSLPEGVYLIHTNLIGHDYSGAVVSSQPEKLEIIKRIPETPEKK